MKSHLQSRWGVADILLGYGYLDSDSGLLAWIQWSLWGSWNQERFRSTTQQEVNVVKIAFEES